MSSSIIFSIIVIILIGIAITCDFSSYSLSDDEIKLLYNNEQNKIDDDNNSVFGDSTRTGVINESDIQSSVANQAEELLQQIYDSR